MQRVSGKEDFEIKHKRGENRTQIYYSRAYQAKSKQWHLMSINSEYWGNSVHKKISTKVMKIKTTTSFGLIASLDALKTLRKTNQRAGNGNMTTLVRTTADYERYCLISGSFEYWIG